LVGGGGVYVIWRKTSTPKSFPPKTLYWPLAKSFHEVQFRKYKYYLQLTKFLISEFRYFALWSRPEEVSIYISVCSIDYLVKSNTKIIIVFIPLHTTPIFGFGAGRSEPLSRLTT
jgi:hypothetical protein